MIATIMPTAAEQAAEDPLELARTVATLTR